MKNFLTLLIALIFYSSLANAQADTTLQNADRFFNLFINGEPEAYSYFAKDFQDKVKPAQIATIRQQFLAKFGKFISIEKVNKMTQQGTEFVLLNTSFEKANPLFTMSLAKDGKLVGFFLAKENQKVTYKDPAYADKSLYEERQLTVEVGEFKMPGILTTPNNVTNFPILVLVHGSDPGDKDLTIGGLKPFRDLALGLATKGIATLRYDKRTSIYRNPMAVGEDFTTKQETEDDALAAIKLASNVDGVDKKQVYALGLSLGGMLMPRIAISTNELAGVIIAAGPARSFQDISIEQNTLSFNQ